MPGKVREIAKKPNTTGLLVLSEQHRRHPEGSATRLT